MSIYVHLYGWRSIPNGMVLAALMFLCFTHRPPEMTEMTRGVRWHQPRRVAWASAAMRSTNLRTCGSGFNG